MRQFFEDYINNCIEADRLSQPDPNKSMEEYKQSLLEADEKITALAKKNDEIIRNIIAPSIDEIQGMELDEILEWQEFAEKLCNQKQRLDIELSLIIVESVLMYARRHKNRDLVIRNLYNKGMFLYHYKMATRLMLPIEIMERQRMYFKEGAAYIKLYDEIESEETRAFIHRCMGNISLAFFDGDEEQNAMKMSALEESLKVLNNPVYRKKTPGIPWDDFVYAQHQQRMTLLNSCRLGDCSPKMISGITESMMYIMDKQKENEKKTGMPISRRWRSAYYQTMFFCGVFTLEQLLEHLFELIEETLKGEHSFDYDFYYGLIMNTGITVEYINRFGKNLPEKYSSRMKKLFRESLTVIKENIHSKEANNLLGMLPSVLSVYYVYTGENEDYRYQTIGDILGIINPRLFIHSYATAFTVYKVMHMIKEKGFEHWPEISLPEDKDVNAFIYQVAKWAFFHDIGFMGFEYLTGSPVRNRFMDEDIRQMIHVELKNSEIDGIFGDDEGCRNTIRYHHFINIPENIENKTIIGIIGTVSGLEIASSEYRFLSFPKGNKDNALKMILAYREFYCDDFTEAFFRENNEVVFESLKQGRDEAIKTICEKNFRF